MACKAPLIKGVPHGDHKIPYSKGGLTTLQNGQLLCPTCNLKKGSKMSEPNIAILRQWQSECREQALKWFLANHREFYINACPAAGKTVAAIIIAYELARLKLIDRVIVVAPTNEIVNQWQVTFQQITARTMLKIRGTDLEVSGYGTDICLTCASVSGLVEAFSSICATEKVLVIIDEIHHNAENASWGVNSITGLSDAKFALILSGTLERSDEERPIWLQYNEHGQIDFEKESIYTMTYGQAISEGYCIPVTFHRHYGKFHIQIAHETTLDISANDDPIELAKKEEVAGLSNALNFYRLACIPQYEKDGVTPNLNGYQCSMLLTGIDHLNETRYQMPNAGGLVICPNIQMANYMAKLIEQIEGTKPVVVHTEAKNASSKIKAFREGNQRWIVCVNMITEGVDIPRLRVLIYLPYAMTELFFRQVVGRIIRSKGTNDLTRGYVVMPAIKIFDEFATKIESEIAPHIRQLKVEPTERTCPTCGKTNDIQADTCEYCEHLFHQIKPPSLKSCPQCNAKNKINASSCFNCDYKFTQDYLMTLAEALRDGAIVRGMQLSEEEVQFGENNYQDIHNEIINSGDAFLISMLRQLPKEAYGRLWKIMEKVKGKND